MSGKITYPVDVEDLRERYIEYVGEEPQREFIESVTNLMNMVFEKGKESAQFES